MTFRNPFLSLRKAVFCAAALCLVLAGSLAAHAQRLPQTVVPEHYTLALTPDLKAATFTGTETIDVALTEPTDHIALNSAEIAFQSVTVTEGNTTLKAVVTLDAAKEQALFTFPSALAAGKAKLTIAYTGILNNELRGFYLSKTAKRNYAVTQFEPTDARRAFPSFDEPAFKATFDVSLVIDAADTAISNSPITSDVAGPATGPGAGKHTLTFGTTPKMSTYLVAFLVGDFECSSGESEGVAIRVCATPDKVALTPYGVEVAKYVLRYYNNYFGIPYPLRKLDLIALPDFEAGAMENFGAITYRETDLLIDAEHASVGAKKEVALVIAHEMAHQWFGDLVTMDWWNNIWLNEGFASWMENKPVAAMHPEWNIDQDVAEGEDGTLNLDAAPTTRAIRAKADTPAEINQMFDGISYGKASDVLLMVENYLGEETFRKGVHAYLAAHLYSNAKAEDFWGAQTATSHKPVDTIMESLVAQPGEPGLTFGEVKDGKVAVSQERFYLSPNPPPVATEAKRKQAWTVPVCFKSESGASDCPLLTPDTTTLSVPAGKLFFADAGGKGYYRSTYPSSANAALVSAVETELTPVERIRLIGDTWAQVRANKVPIGAYLDLVAAVKADPNPQVLGSALGGVSAAWSRIAAGQQEKDAISAWVRATFQPEYAKLGPPTAGESPSTTELRALLFGLLGGIGKDPAVIAQANELTQKSLANPGSVDATLAQTSSSIAAQHGNAALFNQLQKEYETATNPELQEGALRLLATFEDPALLNRSLDYAVSSKVRNQDAVYQFAIALGKEATRDLTWKYIQTNWDKVQGQLTTWGGASLVGSTGVFCSADGRDQVVQFFATHKVAASDQSLKHAVERMDACMELRALQGPKLAEWLAKQGK